MLVLGQRLFNFPGGTEARFRAVGAFSGGCPGCYCCTLLLYGTKKGRLPDGKTASDLAFQMWS